ncbi:MAG: CDP-diacylglycerol--serine O-phosphatidyltransferase [Magnetococcales bacterium]|nr:CDP-diacylglycerol--serine O-phosphatidyltransferase [Magnetococcales bacterium]
MNEVPRPTPKRVYILPNLLTTGGMFCGFYGIMAALGGHYENAAQAILAAGIFDGLDGRVARATGGSSAFGKEYDSLADFLSFGIAPAVLVHQWALTPFNRVGWAAAFLFAVCGALRLARFNVQQHYVQDERISKRYFQGLPIPAAAAILVATILFYLDLGLQVALPSQGVISAWSWLPLGLTFLLAILMVSTLRFRSFKDFSWHRERPFLTLVGVVIFIAVMTIHMATTLFVLGIVYLGSIYWSHREYRRLLAEGKEIEEDEVQDLSV